MRRRETERKNGYWSLGSKIKQWGKSATIATTSSLAKETRGFSVADSCRVCSDRRSGEDKYSSGPELTAKLRRVNEEEFLCNECE